MTNDTVSQVLSGAADYIDKHGWVQGQMQDTKGRCCAVGAIAVAASEVSEENVWAIRSDAENRLARTLVDEETLSIAGDVLGRFDLIVRWNDESGRTKDEVVQALRQAAEVVVEDE